MLAIRIAMLALMATSCSAFQAPSALARSALAPSSRAKSPAMGPFDFLAFGQAGASHILLSDRGKANYLKQQIEDGRMSFAAAAKEYSTCPSASKGGDVRRRPAEKPSSSLTSLDALSSSPFVSVIVRACCTGSLAPPQLGTFKPGQMVGPFNDYCFDSDTKLNELEIVKTNFGLHIVKLTKKP